MDNLKKKLYKIIFEADTSAGKLFDIILIIVIVMSVIVVMLNSISNFSQKYGNIFSILEWFFTFFFTIEYVLRIWISPNRIKYMKSFYGIVDLLSILPTYLTYIFASSHYMLVIRTLRVLRVFRILKLVQYSSQATLIIEALKQSRTKIFVFIFGVLNIVVIIGSIMYIVEGEKSGFTSIPKSIYWAIVTLTTVGYGDISPQTPLGQFLASIIMIIGYGIIAVPTGIVISETKKQISKNKKTCPSCGRTGHDDDAIFCKYCGSILKE